MTAPSGSFGLSPEESRALIRRAQSIIAEILLEATTLQAVPLAGNWFASVGRDLAAGTGRLRSAYLQNVLQLVDTCHHLLVHLEKASAEIERGDDEHSSWLREHRQLHVDRILSATHAEGGHPAPPPRPQPPPPPPPGEPTTLLA